MGLLVKGATIVTQDARRRIFRGDILVEGARIRAVGKRLKRPRGATVIDGKDKLALPGLVNCHTHSPMTLLRGLADDMILEEWLKDKVWPAEARLTAKLARAGAELAILEMLSSGTTSFNDMYFFADEAAGAAEAAGLRAWIGFPVLDFGTPEMKYEAMEGAARRYVARWTGNGLVTPTLAPHATYTCGPRTLDWCGKLAEELGVMIHTHCAETRTEVYDVEGKHGRRPVQQLSDHGCLNERTMLAHCGWITKEEVRAIRGSGAKVAHCPVSNLKLATGGFTPLPELLEVGVPVGLGTDGPASNNTLDMFETMKFAGLVHKHHRWDPQVIPAQRALDMATIGGAAALGKENDLGSIEEGKLADIILVRTDAARMQPLHDPVSQLVYAARGSDVADVIVGGRVLLKEGKPTTMKRDAVIRAGTRAAKRVAAGLGQPVRE